MIIIFSIPNSTSIHLKDLLIKMLKRNPADRINFEDFFSHKFLVEKNDDATETTTENELEFSDKNLCVKNSKSDTTGFFFFILKIF